jgi:hypothetical protein
MTRVIVEIAKPQGIVVQTASLSAGTAMRV